MPTDITYSDNTNLTFFSRMTVLVTHEVKNVLAIINQITGLLEDLMLIPERESHLSPEQMHRLAETIRVQIERVDGIVTRMNGFAHSADRSLDSVDLYHATVIMASMCERMMRSENLVVTIIPPESMVMIQTRPFYLQALIFVCIETIVREATSAKSIRVEIQKIEQGAEIRFSCLDCRQNLSVAQAFGDEFYFLMNYLKAKIIGDSEKFGFSIRLKESIHN